ncbi:MAG: hypothetical protein ABEI80_03720 [Haloplanus sp.]
MSLRTDRVPSVRSHPITAEFALVAAALVGVSLWRRLLRDALSVVTLPPAVDGVLVGGLLAGAVFLAGLVAFAGAYAAARDVDVRLTLPTRSDLPAVGLAVGVPLALVAVTKLVGVATGVPYNALTKTAVAADPPLVPVLLLAGLTVLLGVPTLVVVCQVLVQGSFERVVGGDGAIALTTLVTGFAMTSTAGGLTVVPETGKLVGVVLFVGLLGVGVLAHDRLDRDRTRLRALAYAPLLLFVGLVVLSAVASVDTLAGGLFATAHLAVFAVAAYTYDRTDSLLTPALAYATVLLANRAVVVVLESGMQHW